MTMQESSRYGFPSASIKKPVLSRQLIISALEYTLQTKQCYIEAETGKGKF